MSRKRNRMALLGSGTLQARVPKMPLANSSSGRRTQLVPVPTAAATGVAVYDALLAVLDCTAEPPPDDLPAALAALPEEPALPPLPETWELLRLIPEYRRYNWALKNIFDPLIRDVPEVCRSIARGRTLEGRSPHQPDWFFGLDYGMTPPYWYVRHRHTGESVELHPPPVKLWYWHGRKTFTVFPVWPDAPLCLGEVDPDRAAYRWMVEKLCNTNSGTERSDQGPAECTQVVSKLVRELLHRSDAVAAFHEQWKEPTRRAWLAALLGAWLTAHAAAVTLADPTVTALTGPRAMRWMQRHADLLCDFDSDDYLPEDETPEALLRHDHQAFVQGARSLIVGGWRQPLTVALEKDLPGLEAEAEELFDRFRSPDGEPWEMLGGYYLLRRGIRTQEVLKALARGIRKSPKEFCEDDLHEALRLAQYGVKLGQNLLRKALRAPAEDVRIAALAALAVTDQPWAYELVDEALRHERSEVVRACCRLAIKSRPAQGRGRQRAVVDPAVNDRKQLIRVGFLFSLDKPRKRAGWLKPDEYKDDRTPVREGPYVRYYGTVRELFEDEVENARRYLRDWVLPGYCSV